VLSTGAPMRRAFSSVFHPIGLPYMGTILAQSLQMLVPLTVSLREHQFQILGKTSEDADSSVIVRLGVGDSPGQSLPPSFLSVVGSLLGYPLGKAAVTAPKNVKSVEDFLYAWVDNYNDLLFSRDAAAMPTDKSDAVGTAKAVAQSVDLPADSRSAPLLYVFQANADGDSVDLVRIFAKDLDALKKTSEPFGIGIYVHSDGKYLSIEPVALLDKSGLLMGNIASAMPYSKISFLHHNARAFTSPSNTQDDEIGYHVPRDKFHAILGSTASIDSDKDAVKNST
jgi:hypothetical protein